MRIGRSASRVKSLRLSSAAKKLGRGDQEQRRSACRRDVYAVLCPRAQRQPRRRPGSTVDAGLWHDRTTTPATALMPVFPLPPAAVPAEIPRSVRLQIVSPSAEPPDGDGWLHEVKHDGHRLVAIIAGDKPAPAEHGRRAAEKAEAGTEDRRGLEEDLGLAVSGARYL